MILDMSFMSKFRIQGRDAGKALNRLCTANLDGEVGVITYTQMLNADGKLEADVTVMKQSPTSYVMIVTDTMHRHVEAHLQRHLDEVGNKAVAVSDITGAYAQLNIQGPNSRKLMQAISQRAAGPHPENPDVDMWSEEHFPFRTAREMPIGLARAHVARITYVGELGYELHIPAEHALHVHNEVVEAAREAGIEFNYGGLKALASLRLEKGYRDFGHDMDNTDTLLEVGLGFTADFNKPDGFVGKEAVLHQKETEQKVHKGFRKRLVNCFVPVSRTDKKAHDENSWVMIYHAEPIFRDGVCVGDVRVGSYGHTLGGPVGLAHIAPAQPEDASAPPVIVNKKYITTGKWEVEINGKMHPLQLSLQPFYDPKNARIKALD